jgi:hypothetical protein
MTSFFQPGEQARQEKKPSRSAQSRLEEQVAVQDPNGRKQVRKAAAGADAVVRVEVRLTMLLR